MRIGSTICSRATIAGAVLFVVGSCALGSDYTWVDPGRDVNWNDPGVWTGCGYPGSAGDVACLAANTSRAVSLNGLSVALGKMCVSDPSGDGNFAILPGGGGQLTFNAGLPGPAAVLLVTQSSPGAGTTAPLAISAPVVLDSDLISIVAAPWSDVLLSGPVLGPAGLTKVGQGVLTLASAGDANYTGAVQVVDGTLELREGAALTSASGIQVYADGTLSLVNLEMNLSNRLSASGCLTMRGGTFQFVGAEANQSSQNAGVLSLASGDSWIINTPGLSGGNAKLSFTSFSRQTGATLNFVGAFGTSADQILLNADANLVVLTGGILGGWATAGADWASYEPNVGVTVLPASSYLSQAVDGNWTIAVNAKPGGPVVLTANRTINSLNKALGGNIAANGFT